MSFFSRLIGNGPVISQHAALPPTKSPYDMNKKNQTPKTAQVATKPGVVLSEKAENSAKKIHQDSIGDVTKSISSLKVEEPISLRPTIPTQSIGASTITPKTIYKPEIKQTSSVAAPPFKPVDTATAPKCPVEFTEKLIKEVQAKLINDIILAVVNIIADEMLRPKESTEQLIDLKMMFGGKLAAAKVSPSYLITHKGATKKETLNSPEAKRVFAYFLHQSVFQMFQEALTNPYPPIIAIKEIENIDLKACPWGSQIVAKVVYVTTINLLNRYPNICTEKTCELWISKKA